MTANRKVDILILNFGNHADTIECLESIESNNHQNYRVTLIDITDLNNSVAVLMRWLSDRDPSKYRSIALDVNNGFAFANNIGIKQILALDDSDFIWLLNNDTIIAPDSITKLIAYHERIAKQNPGLIGSKLLDYYNRDLIQTMGSRYKPWTGYFRIIGENERDQGQYDMEILNVDYIFGATMFFHKSLIAKIGYIPEEYFLYYEDVDWCVSANKAGFQTTVCAESVVYHKQGGSTGTHHRSESYDSGTALYLYKNYLRFYRKHHPLLIPIAYLIMLKQLAGHLYHRRSKAARHVLNAILGKQQPNNQPYRQ